MLQAETAVVALHDVPEVIGVGLDGRIVFVINVVHAFVAEGTLLQAWIDPTFFRISYKKGD